MRENITMDDELVDFVRLSGNVFSEILEGHGGWEERGDDYRTAPLLTIGLLEPPTPIGAPADQVVYLFLAVT